MVAQEENNSSISLSQPVLELKISVSSAIILIYNTHSRSHPGINLRLHTFLPPLSSQREFRVYTGARKKKLYKTK
jgi:hypothetical protein